VLTAAIALPSSSSAGVDIGLSVDRDGVKGFYLAIGEHYQVAEKEVVAVRKHTVSEDELTVVFFLSEQSRVKASVVIDLRRKGLSWWDISLRLGLPPEVFFVQLKKDPGPPYGKAYGHYKNKKKHGKKWKEVSFADADIVNLVNLRFVSERYGYSPDEVISLRSKGKSFVEINDHVKTKVKKKAEASKVSAKGDDPKSKKGKGKKK
jgi:hypothetical protein